MSELPTLSPFFSDKRDRLEEILGRYPSYGRRSALMPLLWEVQRAERHVSEARLREIAEILGLSATEVKGVMTFYSSYHEHPVGMFHIQICSTLSCSLAGSDEMCDFLVEELGIVPGETDTEGRFSLQKVECLGSCTTAPVLQVNDTYYECVTKSRCRQLIESLRADELPEPWRERRGDADNTPKGAAKATPKGTVDGTPDEAAVAPNDAAARGTPKGAADGKSKGTADDTPQRTADDMPKRNGDGTSGGAADGTRKEAADDTSKKAADGTTDGGGDGSSKGAADVPKEAAVAPNDGAAKATPKGAAGSPTKGDAE